MFDGFKNSIVKRGHYLYGNEEREIIIVESNTLFGTGDYEDHPEIANDKEVLCYYCGFENLVNNGDFNAWSSACLSIDEAISYAENALSVTWN